MHAALLRSVGKSPQYEQFPEPVALDGEAIVSVRAAALKPIDKQLASGPHFARPRGLPPRLWHRRGWASQRRRLVIIP